MKIAELWASFESQVIPNAGPVQRIEMKKAFYAGVHSCFELVGVISETLPEKAAMNAMSGIHDELMLFAQGIVAEQNRTLGHH